MPDARPPVPLTRPTQVPDQRSPAPKMPTEPRSAVQERLPLTWADFDSEEGFYSQLPAQPLDVRRKFIGHDKTVWAIAKAGRKVAFAKYAKLSGEFLV